MESKWYDYLEDLISEENWEYGSTDFTYRRGMVAMAAIAGLIDFSQEKALILFLDECYSKRKVVKVYES